MYKYIALLRGINVGGRNKIIMSDLRALFRAIGFTEVTTYIQSGNIIFRSKGAKSKELEQRIEREIERKYGYSVPVIVLTGNKLEKILGDNPLRPIKEDEFSKMYYVFLKEFPESEAVAKFKKNKYENEKYIVSEDYIYLKCLSGMGKARLTTNLLEKNLNVQATARNHKTALKILELTKN